jgi:hypothetical protein
MNMMIAYAPGGTYDATGRLLARHMPRHIPGQPVMVPQNMPGSAGLKAILHLYTIAPKDGGTIAMLPRGYPIEPIFSPDAAKYDPARFNPIGSTSTEVSIGVAWHTKPFKQFSDLMEREIIVAANGLTDDTGRYPTMVRNLTGAKIKIVTGYPGGNDLTIAMERGEVDGRFGWSWGSVKSRSKDWLDEKKITILLQMALQKAPDLPDVPLILDFAKNERDRQALELLFTQQAVAWPLIAPPDVPADRVALLRKAFDVTMKDSEFLAEAAKLRIDVDPLSGLEMQTLIARIAAFPPAVIERALELSRP